MFKPKKIIEQSKQIHLNVTKSRLDRINLYHAQLNLKGTVKLSSKNRSSV